jgi:hypothetical protein
MKRRRPANGIPFALIRGRVLRCLQRERVTSSRELVEHVFSDVPLSTERRERLRYSAITAAVYWLRRAGHPIRSEGHRGYYLEPTP